MARSRGFQHRGVEVRALLAATALALLIAGCDADVGGGSSSPGVDPTESSLRPSSSQSTHTSPAGHVVVPNFAADPIRVAVKGARALGLRTRLVRGPGTACLPNRTVVQQRPAYGAKVEVGTRVRLVINVNTHLGGCGLDLPPVSKDLRRIAERFVHFARTPQPRQFALPVDTPVELFVGGALQNVIPSGRINDPQEWRTCPEGGYAARSCPISALTPFAHYPGPIAATTQAPVHLCVPAWKLPERLNVYRSVTLTPDEGRDCTSYFAVQLFVNDVGQIVAVHLVLSDP
jgi:hypothetical protein